jgi:hypothetical protein
MNDMEEEDTPHSHAADENEIESLSQRMSDSLPGGSQRSNIASQNRGLTPEYPNPPSRLQSVVPSDPGGEVFYGPEDDPALASQNSMDSNHSENSQFSEQRSDGIGSQNPSGGGERGGWQTHPMNRYKNDSIYDSQRYAFPLRRYWHPDGLLVCQDRHREYLYSQAKSMGLSVNSEKSEAYGITWSLVFPFEGFGLPEPMIRAIYFFTMIESLSTHHNWNHCVVQTNNLQNNLYPRFHNKDIQGVLEGTCTEDSSREYVSTAGAVDLNDLLQASENSSSGMVYKALPLLRMNIGITGALYKMDGKEKRKLFGILYVHWLLNVDFMQLMLVSLFICLFASPRLILSVFSRKRSSLSQTPKPLILTMSTRHGMLSSTPLSPFSSIKRTT